MDRLDRLESVPDALVSAMTKVEQEATKRVLALIKELDTVDGVVSNSSKNISLIKRIESDLAEALFSNSYYKALNQYEKEFKVQAKLTNEYFETILDEFEVLEKYTKALEISTRSALNLLSTDSFNQVLIKPIQDSLLSSVQNKGNIKNLIASLTEIVAGNKELDGRIMAHVKRVAYDSFAVANRSYSNMIAVENGLVWRRYAGGKVSDSRCFCLDKVGGYYHIEEIKAWGRGEEIGKCSITRKGRRGWQGMNTNTNSETIFQYVGGYRCMHDLDPVGERRVPEEWKQRAREKGYIE